MRCVTRGGGTIAAATWDTRGGFVALRILFDAAVMLDQNGHQARAAAYTRPMRRPVKLTRIWPDAGRSDFVRDLGHMGVMAVVASRTLPRADHRE